MKLACYGVCLGLPRYPFALFVLLVPRSIALRSYGFNAESDVIFSYRAT